MNPSIATVIVVVGIVGLFFLDRDQDVRTSKALWIPVIWFLILGSRPVSLWSNKSQTVSLQRFTEGSPADAALFSLLIIAGVLALNMRTEQVKKVLQDNLPIVLFVAYCALSIAWSDYPFVGLKRWIKAVGDLVMILVVLTDRNPEAAVKRLFSRGAFLLLPLSVLLVKYYPGLGREYTAQGVPLYMGVTTSKNLLGMTCLVCGLGVLWSFLERWQQRNSPRRMRHLIALGLTLLVAVWLIRKADSMTSLSCLLSAGAVMVLSSQKWVVRRRGYVHALIGGAVGISFFAVFIDTVGTLVHSLGRDTTLTGRTQIWKAVLSMGTNPLLGTGFENFWLGDRLQTIWDMTEKGIQEAHNGYLEIYINLGWVGLLLLGTIIVAGYRSALASFRHEPRAAALRAAFITAGLIYSLTEAGFRMLCPIWMMFLLTNTISPISSRDKVLQPELPAHANHFVPKRSMRILQ